VEREGERAGGVRREGGVKREGAVPVIERKRECELSE
jgi:hypothetical protein